MKVYRIGQFTPQAAQRDELGDTMRKGSLFAGFLFVAALLLAQPAKADSVVDFSLTGHGLTITFSLPQTATPANFTFNNIAQFTNISGSLFSFSPYPYGTVELGLAGFMGVTNYWDFGSTCITPGCSGAHVQFYAPGLFVFNGDGTITINGGTFILSDALHQHDDYVLTTTVINDTVGTPEPASLVLLGVGSLALAGLRRRKTA